MQNGPTSQQNLYAALFLAAVTLAMAAITVPFWKPIFWAVIFAILFWPLRERWTRGFGGRPTLATIAIILVILFFVLIPTLIVVGLIAEGAASLAVAIQTGAFRPADMLSEVEGWFPQLDTWLETLGIELERLEETLRNAVFQASQYALSRMVSIGQGASIFLFHVFIFLYLTFWFLLIGDRIFERIFAVMPLTIPQKRAFFSSFATMSVATIKGTVVVGVVQGALGYLAFWYLDIPGAIFWGALMGLFSIIPPFGAGFIWAPTGLYLIVAGEPLAGVALLAWGGLVISTSDNLVRPWVVGRATSMPDFLVLISTLGGLAVFGLTGLFAGPIVAALFLAAWRVNAEGAAEDPAEDGQPSG